MFDLSVGLDLEQLRDRPKRFSGLELSFIAVWFAAERCRTAINDRELIPADKRGMRNRP